ncbi:hypothetical protein [Neobacillus drentensis]
MNNGWNRLIIKILGTDIEFDFYNMYKVVENQSVLIQDENVVLNECIEK